MPGSDFDIYQTEDGYVAVTNEVRRTILAALAKKDRMLPDLVKLTKKAKPTLSSVHMRELLAAKLVEELPHPTDKRKKVYRLKARRIGTSNLPMGELRGAVRGYAQRGAAGLSLEAIAAAPASAPDATLRAQARRLGALLAPGVPVSSARESVTAFATLIEREGLARPLRLDLEGASMELELEKGEEDVEPSRAALLVASLCEGLLAPKLGDDARVKVAALHGRRATLQLPAGWER
ncbi:MAG TPA: winged helix-turn-helix domain-containing protein [Candidatus Thermoplasmatota archaeon]|nr:winged helix-turn-helix domain-containing protein [Candidatus Thermoplasmatota archaeon]